MNRIIGRREAVVEDVPGVTRDRVTYDAVWRGRRFTVVDTGGWDPDAVGLQVAVSAQAEIAVAAADAVLFVVDSVVGATDADEAVVKVLRRAKKPVVLAANKVDDERGEADAAALWSLGLGEPYVVSALHGRGSGDLLDAILEALPETPAERFETQEGPRRVALLGRPNVGKSSLLNRLRRGDPRARGQRGRHHPRPGRLAGRGRRGDLAVCRHCRAAPPRQPRQRRRVLLEPADPLGPGRRRGRRRPAGRQRADLASRTSG